jgi:tight adherence protein B
MPFAALAATAAAVAAALATPRSPTRTPVSRSAPIRMTVVGAAGGIAVLALSTPRVAVLAVVALGVGAAAALLLRRRRCRRAAQQVAGRVLETCELLAAELASGQPPGRCLGRAAASWSPLRPVAEAHDLGGDVPTALRRLATLPGAADLRLVAAAWAVSSRSGPGLAGSVRRCADGLREAQRARRIVEGELASARATARLVAMLPALALLMGSGAGGRPLAFLFGHPLGLACLAGGLLFGFAGLWWIEVIAGDMEDGP